MYYTIYQTKNLINSKIYIGKHQTLDLEDGYMGSGKYLNRSIKKHGLENFEKTILFIFETEDEMNAKEKELVTEEFCDRKDTYNICEGGKGGFGYINRNVYTPQKRKLASKRAAQTTIDRHGDDFFKKWYKNWATKNPEKYKANREKITVSKAENFANGLTIGSFTGKQHTEETKKKIGAMTSAAMKGCGNSQYGTCWINNGKENKKIRKDELAYWEKMGYVKGRKMKFD